MPWSKRLESKEKEVPDDVLVVMVQLIKTCYDIADTQFFLSVLQQGHECSLAAVSQLAAGHAHVQSVLPEHGIPVCANTAKTSSRETNLYCSILVAVTQILVCIFSCICSGFQSITHRVRGIS